MNELFTALADALDWPADIEVLGRRALLEAAPRAAHDGPAAPLRPPFVAAMTAPGAHPACAAILRAPLPWAPPHTSRDPAYLAVGAAKSHVELLGPGGLVRSDAVRLGLYGMMPDAAYGERTHPAEEVFVMLAGRAGWRRDRGAWDWIGPGGRSAHPSGMPHATRTGAAAFMSVYVWRGDISTEGYRYRG